ncbi:MAG: FHA domain-containing protein [bacterium]
MGKFSKLAKNAGKKSNKLYFVFTDGKYKGGEFHLSFADSLTLGRDITSDVAVVDERVSRVHAIIKSKDEKAFITDQNSTNGTLLNGDKLEGNKPVELSPGDKVSIGASTFEFLGTTPEKTSDKESASDSPAEKPKEEEEVSVEIAGEDIEVADSDKKSVKDTLSKPDKKQSEPGEFFIDENLEDSSVITKNKKKPSPKASSDQNSGKKSVGRINLKKKDIRRSKTIPDNKLESSSGKFEDISSINLLSLLLQSDSSGILNADISKPFEEKIEVKIASNGCAAAKSLTNKDFCDEKALSRILLAEKGDYSFDTSGKVGKSDVNDMLEDLIMETASMGKKLEEYKQLLEENSLTFRIPMKGQLSRLNKKELDKLQFMVNAQEIMVYLDMTPEKDDLYLLSEIKKYIDKGLLKEPVSDKKIETVDEDEIFDM